MAIKAGGPGKRPGNIPADVRGVQVRPEWITEHAKKTSFRQVKPCLFPVRWCFCPGSIPGGTVPQAFIAVLRRFYRQTVRSTAQAVKTPYRGKIQAQAAQKNHCTLTIIYIGAML